MEGLAAFEEATGQVLTPAGSRRNLLTQGIDLTTLGKAECSIGEVRFAGIRLCQPCKYLARKTGIENLVKGLIGRGGIRARILSEGIIREGDRIVCE